MTLEGKIKKRVTQFLQSYKYPDGQLWYDMPVGGAYGKSGLPDYVMCCRGTFVGIETKADRAKTLTD